MGEGGGGQSGQFWPVLQHQPGLSTRPAHWVHTLMPAGAAGLSGTIPLGLYQMPNLTQLNLALNTLTGTPATPWCWMLPYLLLPKQLDTACALSQHGSPPSCHQGCHHRALA